MAETSKVRLVRCPKCENLLPELPDYSVYQCGGCGAVLRAKKGNLEGVKGLERSDEERVAVVSDKSEKFLGKSESFVVEGRLSGVEDGEVKVSDSKEGGETVAESFGNDSKREVGKLGVEDGNGNGSKREVSKWSVATGNGISSKNELGNGHLESKVNKLDTRVENANGLRKPSRVFERKVSDVGEEERFGRARRGYLEGMRSSSSNYVGEGPSMYRMDSSYQNETGRGIRAEYVEPDREELLRKLDELKEQLSRVQNGNDKYREKVPVEHRMAPLEPYVESEEYFRDHPSSYHRVSRQFSAPNKHAARPPYFESYHEPFPAPNRADMAPHVYHNPMRSSSYGPRYEDPFESQMFRRPPQNRIPTHHQYMTPELDHYEPHMYDMPFNHLSCSCYRCYDPQQQAPVQVPSSTLGNRRFPPVANKSMACQHDLHGAFGLNRYNSRVVNAPPVGACDPEPQKRWPKDPNHEMGAVARARPQRVVLANGHRCRPVVGGAPFVTCQNCFELLKLPKKVLTKKGEWQMSCGACSSVNTFAVVDEKLVSVDALVKQTTEALDSSNEMGLGHVKRDHGSFCSEDYANSAYDFQAMDRDPISSSTYPGVSSSKSEEMHNLHSVSATTSEDEHFLDNLAARQGVTPAAEAPENAAVSPPVGSPPQEHFDYTSKYRAVNRCGKGNLSSRSDQERVMTNKSTLRQNSLKESLATEMEISLNEYADAGLSQDSADKCKEDDRPKAKKGDSFLAGIIKKSFRDFSRSNQNIESGKRNVTVNGHLIPDKLVKKAEKQAGPIYPGQYWYDYRAGFWGAIGGPCLGIIPPFIEEFNYPIPENCAAGNTGVFVNGRELHQKDLDLLSTRGLPAVGDRSYIVEISGRVVDEDTGEELDSLGKLAPTIEKVKHGFGMRAP